LQKKTKLNENQVQTVIAFLREYEFVTINGTKEGIRLQETVRRFLTENVTS
jgi:hypothetical protein